MIRTLRSVKNEVRAFGYEICVFISNNKTDKTTYSSAAELCYVANKLSCRDIL